METLLRRPGNTNRTVADRHRIRMLTAARVRVTDLEAQQAQVDAEIRDGLLVKAEDVKRIGFERAVTLRDKLLGLPAEWALQLAAITDPALVADFTRKRIKQALIEYCAAYGVHQAEPESDRRTTL